jgi:hypothetical protein
MCFSTQMDIPLELVRIHGYPLLSPTKEAGEEGNRCMRVVCTGDYVLKALQIEEYSTKGRLYHILKK